MTTLQLVEGFTEPVDAVLSGDGTALNLTGHTVAIAIHDRAGAAVTTGVAAIVEASAGRVRYSPSAEDTFSALLSPYTVHWKITNTATGKITYLPRGVADKWIINKQ